METERTESTYIYIYISYMYVYLVVVRSFDQIKKGLYGACEIDKWRKTWQLAEVSSRPDSCMQSTDSSKLNLD